jgi:hypothetical protein
MGPTDRARLRPLGYAGHASPKAKRGGARRDRTADLLHAMQALSQLSYGPVSLDCLGPIFIRPSGCVWATRREIRNDR